MDNRTPALPQLVTTKITSSNSKMNVSQDTDQGSGVRERLTVYNSDWESGARIQIDPNNLAQLKGFEMNLKRKVAERYGGSYRDLSSVKRRAVSHHKSVQTLCTAPSSSDLRVRPRLRRRPHSADMTHSVVPSHRVIIRREQLQLLYWFERSVVQVRVVLVVVVEMLLRLFLPAGSVTNPTRSSGERVSESASKVRYIT